MRQAGIKIGRGRKRKRIGRLITLQEETCRLLRAWVDGVPFMDTAELNKQRWESPTLLTARS